MTGPPRQGVRLPAGPVDDWPPVLDPDCRAGKHGSCVAGPCECSCHRQLPMFGEE